MEYLDAAPMACTLEGETYEQLYLRAEKLVLKVPPQCRNEAMKEFVECWMTWLPRKLSTSLKVRNLRAEVADATDSILGVRKSDLKLTELILSGALQGHDVIRTLVSSLVTKAVKLKSQSRTRLTASSIPDLGISLGDVSEAGFALSCCSGMNAPVKFFGLSPRAMASMDLCKPGFPIFFCASPDREGTGPGNQLSQNIDCTLKLLNVESHSRNYVLTFDDTVVWPQYGLLQLGDERFIIGGTEGDAMMPADPDRNLDPRRLKKESLHQAWTFHHGSVMCIGWGLDASCNPTANMNLLAYHHEI